MRLPLPPRTPSQRLRDALASPGHRAVLLWMILLLAFVVIWQAFAVREVQGGPGGPQEPPAQQGMWPGVLLQLLPLLGAGGFFGIAYVRMRRFAAVNKHGVDLMTRGDSAAAAEIFRGLARKPLGLRGIANVNLGLALLRQGDLGGALGAFASSERGRTRARAAYRPMVAALVALCNALAGDLDAAERWVEEARRRSAGPTGASRVHLAAEAIVRCRRGDPAGASRILDQAWGEIERSTGADLVRGFRIVRAFAAESAGGPLATSAGDLIAGARPFRAGEYGWLGAGWPEMARYLEAKGFAPPAA